MGGMGHLLICYADLDRSLCKILGLGDHRHACYHILMSDSGGPFVAVQPVQEPVHDRCEQEARDRQEHEASI